MPKSTKELQAEQAALKAIIAKGKKAECDLEESRMRVLWEQDEALVDHARAIGNLAYDFEALKTSISRQVKRLDKIASRLSKAVRANRRGK